MLKIKQAEKILLQAGRYPSTLIDVKEDTKRVYQSEEVAPCYAFIFAISTPKGLVEMKKKCWPTNSKKGNLYKLACDLHPDGIVPDDVRMDTEKFEKLVFGFKGKRYLLTIELNGEWNNIVSASPLGQLQMDTLIDNKAGVSDASVDDFHI